MIRLEFSQAVALYLFFSVIAILALWIVLEYGKRDRKFTSTDEFIWHCSICDYTYIDSRHEGLSQCPRCGSYVERKRESSSPDQEAKHRR